VRLSELTTLRLGGPAARYLEAASEQAVIDAVTEADRAGEPLLVLADHGSAGATYIDLRLPERPAAGGLEDPTPAQPVQPTQSGPQVGAQPAQPQTQPSQTPTQPVGP